VEEEEEEEEEEVNQFKWSHCMQTLSYT
jgi:hypothetical protein